MGEARSKFMIGSDTLQHQSFPWFALKVRTRSEPAAASGLQTRGYDPFCPVYIERRRYCDRVKSVENPVFPGYLFCRFDPTRKVPVISSPAVEYVLGSSGVLSEIPEQEIANIRRSVEAGALPSNYLKAGQRVRVEYGSLAGVEGVLVREGAKHRLIVSVELLQRAVSLHIDQDQITVL